MEFERRADAKSKATSRDGTSQNKTTEKAKELLTAIDEIQKKIAEKEELKAKYVSDGLENTLAYFGLLQEISKLLTQMEGLKLPLSTLDVTATAEDIKKKQEPRYVPEEIPTGKIEEMKFSEKVTVLASESNTLLGNIQSVMNIFGMETNKFVSGIITGFNTVLTIMESIKAVQTILNIIPFFATGGIMQQSGLAVVGDAGPELVHLPAGARVYNNQDTQKYFNSINSQPQAVNVYVNANLDGLKFLENNMPKYFDKRNFKRIN